jgi:TorA maturation chaperone TorD
MKDLLIIKSQKGNCSIVNNFFSRFIANCYIVALWNCHRVLVLCFYSLTFPLTLLFLSQMKKNCHKMDVQNGCHKMDV